MRRGDDGVDDPEEMLLAVEADVGEEDLALALDVDHLMSVDHDLGQAVVVDERAQRAQRLEITGVDAFGGSGDAHDCTTPVEVVGRWLRPRADSPPPWADLDQSEPVRDTIFSGREVGRG
jgi:hypothetical protein